MTQSDQVSREDVEAAIRDAFAGVRLGDGISLSMAEAIDDWVSPRIMNGLRGTEVGDDWAAIPASEIERAEHIAHLDPEGLRYYLPALMLRLLDDYQPAEMWSIGTISALDQRDGHPLGFLELLSAAQRRAIATYVRALPDLVELDHEDAAQLSRAYRDVWSHDLAEHA